MKYVHTSTASTIDKGWTTEEALWSARPYSPSRRVTQQNVIKASQPATDKIMHVVQDTYAWNFKNTLSTFSQGQ